MPCVAEQDRPVACKLQLRDIWRREIEPPPCEAVPVNLMTAFDTTSCHLVITFCAYLLDSRSESECLDASLYLSFQLLATCLNAGNSMYLRQSRAELQLLLIEVTRRRNPGAIRCFIQWPDAPLLSETSMHTTFTPSCMQPQPRLSRARQRPQRHPTRQAKTQLD